MRIFGFSFFPEDVAGRSGVAGVVDSPGQVTLNLIASSAAKREFAAGCDRCCAWQVGPWLVVKLTKGRLGGSKSPLCRQKWARPAETGLAPQPPPSRVLESRVFNPRPPFSPNSPTLPQTTNPADIEKARRNSDNTTSLPACNRRQRISTSFSRYSASPDFREENSSSDSGDDEDLSIAPWGPLACGQQRRRPSICFHFQQSQLA